MICLHDYTFSHIIKMHLPLFPYTWKWKRPRSEMGSRYPCSLISVQQECFMSQGQEGAAVERSLHHTALPQWFFRGSTQITGHIPQMNFTFGL